MLWVLLGAKRFQPLLKLAETRVASEEFGRFAIRLPVSSSRKALGGVGAVLLVCI